MKTTFKQKLSTLVLGLFAFAGFAQCPTSAAIYSLAVLDSDRVVAFGSPFPSNGSTTYHFIGLIYS